VTKNYHDFQEEDVEDDGDLVVVWTASGRDDPRTIYGAGVFAQRLSETGARVGTEFQVNQFTTGYQQSADVAMQPSGGFVVAWSDAEQEENAGIFARRYDADGDPAGDEIAAHSYATADKFVPRVAASGDGTFLVVWSSPDQDGSDDGVYAQRFDANSGRLGTEFRVNTNTANAQYRPAISADGDGNVAIVWQRNLSVDQTDVALQRFTVITVTGICGDPVALTANGRARARAGARAGLITASDALSVLRAAVGTASCELCVCDVNGSGEVTASDALIVLRTAVGQSTSLDCPPCS
jgi:hypothetical protein